MEFPRPIGTVLQASRTQEDQDGAHMLPTFSLHGTDLILHSMNKWFQSMLWMRPVSLRGPTTIDMLLLLKISAFPTGTGRDL